MKPNTIVETNYAINTFSGKITKEPYTEKIIVNIFT